MTRIKIFALLFFFLSIAGQQLTAKTIAKNGMVVSSNELASEVGIEILKRGGNAIDASVATAFALAVTLPSAGNIGGGGFIVYMDSSGSATTFDFREKAPLQASTDMYLDESGNLNKGINPYGHESTINHIGLKSVGVPGTVAGLYLAHKKYGSLPWADLLQSAIDLANNGFRLTWTLYRHAVFFEENSEIQFLKDYSEKIMANLQISERSGNNPNWHIPYQK